MDFDISHWIEIFQKNPVLMIMVGGLTIGSGFTQVIKKTWLAFSEHPISIERYRASCMWLAIMSTTLGTYLLWHALLFEDTHGLGKAVALVNGAPAPLSYKGIKALVAWKFPALAKTFGDNGRYPDPLPKP